MLFVAMSSLQGRPMQTAAEELLAAGSLASVGKVGLQLTPGCAPTEGFAQWLAASGVPTRSHHGFSWTAMRRPVWSPDATLLAHDHSVHPPRLSEPASERFWETAARNNVAYETMYPGYVLGSAYDLERAMDAGMDLAVDVSHLYIQLMQNALGKGGLERVFRYERVAEVHVSANDGRSDQHRTICANTFGLDWALEKLAVGTPVIVESYLHRLAHVQRVEMFSVFKSPDMSERNYSLNGALQ